MSLIKFNNKLFPWNSENMQRFFNDDFFDSNFFIEGSQMPAMNIKEHEKNFEIEFAIPGFKKKDFDITMRDNVMTISGEKQREKESKEDEFTRKEFSYNSFKRSFNLPESIDVNNDIKATYEDGILRLNLKKKKDQEMIAKKSIEVQ